jgi:arylsulfatase
MHEWTPDKDQWELYNLEEDWTQANDLAAKMPEKLAEMKELFAIEAARNNVYPVGGGLYIPVFHPELRISTPYKEWSFAGDITRMPEFTAPKLGNAPNLVTIDADLPADANGVLYALGAFSGGLSLYVKDGVLSYEYNLFEIMRTQIKATEKLPAGKAKIEVETSSVVAKPGGPLKVALKVNGREMGAVTTVNGKEVKAVSQVDGLEVGPGIVPVSAPLLFTANDCLDLSTDLGSPVSLDYFDTAPFPFNGTIEHVHVKYTK